jgi:hypothetical protein
MSDRTIPLSVAKKYNQVLKTMVWTWHITISIIGMLKFGHLLSTVAQKLDQLPFSVKKFGQVHIQLGPLSPMAETGPCNGLNRYFLIILSNGWGWICFIETLRWARSRHGVILLNKLCLLPASCFGYNVDPDEGDMFIGNFGWIPMDYTVLYPRRHNSWRWIQFTILWELLIMHTTCLTNTNSSSLISIKFIKILILLKVCK